MTHFRCGGIFNDFFITRLLRSLTVKEFWKSVNICQSYGQLSTGLFFLWSTVYIIYCDVQYWTSTAWRTKRSPLSLEQKVIAAPSRLCLFFSRITQKVVNKFRWHFLDGCTANIRHLDFGAAPDYDAEPGIFNGNFYRCRRGGGKIVQILPIAEEFLKWTFSDGMSH